MKKSVIFLTVLLLATIAGTYAVYELYVKQRMKELGEHKAQEAVLRERIAGLEEKFEKKIPDVYLEAWRRSTQPWSDAVQGRSQFFTMGDFVKKVEIPEEVIPKTYYRTELPKRVKALEDYAYGKQVKIGDSGCGVPSADAFGEGKTPTREEIAGHLETYDYCAALTKKFVDAKPVSLQPLRIWPELAQEVKSGTIKTRTTGVTMRMTTQAFVRFLDDLARSDRYFRVEEFRIANSDLRATDPELEIELVLTQAYFESKKKASDTAGAGAAGSPQVNDRLQSVFGGGAGGANAQGGSRSDRREREPQLTPWQQFRRKWLPF